MSQQKINEVYRPAIKKGALWTAVHVVILARLVNNLYVNLPTCLPIRVQQSYA